MKRCFSFLVALAMVFSLLPGTALAAETAEDAVAPVAAAEEEPKAEEKSEEPVAVAEEKPEVEEESEASVAAAEEEPEAEREAVPANADAAEEIAPASLDRDEEAAPVETSGDYEYSVSNGKAKITGYTGTDAKIAVPSELGGYPVTSIDKKAFYECTDLTEVTIPNSVTSIGDDAFYSCQNLVAVTLGNGLTRIGAGAFGNCGSLTSVTIPNSVTRISSGAFKNCTSLTSVALGDGVTSIGTSAFSNCTSLTEVKIPNCVTSIEAAVFCQCTSLAKVTIPNGVTSIGWAAFSGCTSLTEVTIPNSVTSIGIYAFYNCTSLTEVTIPNSVTSIKNWAFSACTSLTSVTIPASVTAIGDYAFGYTDELVDADDCEYDRIEDFAICGDAGSVAQVYAEENGFTFVSLNVATPKLSSVSNAATGVKITWGAVDGAVNYRVRRKVSGSDWITVGTSTSTSYTDTSAKSGTTYIYTVCCVSPDDRITTSANSGSKSIKYIAAPKLSGVSNTTSGVKVSWGKVSGAEKYIVSRKTGSGSWAELDSTTSTSYTDTSAKSGTTYAYRVKAVASDDTSTSAYSGSKSIKYIAAPKLSGVSNTTSGVKVIWGKVTGAANYLIYRKTGSGKWTELDSTTSTSYTDKTAKAGTTYAYCMKVVASDGTSTSAYSGSKSIKYIAAPKLSSVSNAAKGVTIKWSASKGAVKYRVYRKNGSGSWGIIGETTSTSYTDTTAKAGTTYTYTVRCITADGKSTTSGYDSTGKTIKRLTQPTPTVSKTSSGIKTSWSKVSGANKYYVYRKTASGGWSKIATTTSTSYTDKTAKKGTTYYYTVKAASGSYSSSYTSSKAVKR